MPSDQVHLFKLRITEDAHNALQPNSNKHPDWVVITAFYQALHWVDAFLAKTQRHPTNHVERNNEVKNDVDLKAIKRNYRRLYRASRFARYYAKTYIHTPNEVKSLKADLNTIVNHIKPLL